MGPLWRGAYLGYSNRRRCHFSFFSNGMTYRQNLHDKTGHPVCTHTPPRRHARALCPNGVPRSLHAARDTAVVLFYRRYYFSLAFRYCILVRPVYPFVCFHRPWPRIYYYYPERPAAQKRRERKEDTSISRDVNGPLAAYPPSARNPRPWELYFAWRDRKPTSHCSPHRTGDVQSAILHTLRTCSMKPLSAFRFKSSSIVKESC